MLIRTTPRIWGLTPFFGRLRPKMGCLTPIALQRNAPMNHSPNGLRGLHPQSNANAEDRCIKHSPTAFFRLKAAKNFKYLWLVFAQANRLRHPWTSNVSKGEAGDLSAEALAKEDSPARSLASAIF